MSCEFLPNFDRGTLFAEGKFGPVYRGSLPGGFHVAVKVLVYGSALTDEQAARELDYLRNGTIIMEFKMLALKGFRLLGGSGTKLHLAVAQLVHWHFFIMAAHPRLSIETSKQVLVFIWITTWSQRYLILDLPRSLVMAWMRKIAHGSPGYVPPEFSDPDNSCSTPKSDVYCFGVVFFGEDLTLVSWVRGLVRRPYLSVLTRLVLPSCPW